MTIEKVTLLNMLFLSLLKTGKKVRDNNGYSAAVLMDLSKAFDTLNNDLLIANIHAYDIRGTFLKLLKIYLRNRY